MRYRIQQCLRGQVIRDTAVECSMGELAVLVEIMNTLGAPLDGVLVNVFDAPVEADVPVEVTR